jgi:hypothetical protein
VPITAWFLATALASTQVAGPRPDVLKKICATEFGRGDMARVDVLLDKAKAVKVLVLRPDITRFSHAPHTYFDPDGSTLLVVAERPITPESARTDPVLRKLDALVRDLTPGRSMYCSGHR